MKGQIEWETFQWFMKHEEKQCLLLAFCVFWRLQPSIQSQSVAAIGQITAESDGQEW